MFKVRAILGVLALLWKLLPMFLGAIGYLFFSPPASVGLVMGALFALAGVLIKKLYVLATPARTSHGSARFATNDDITRAHLTGRKGMILGRRALRLLRYAGDGHLLTFAPTRSGKGVSCVIPNLLAHPGSVVVTDIKGENIAVTRKFRERLGPVYELAPFKDDENPASYNPFDFIRRGTLFEVDDTRLIAEMLVISERHEPNHWEREARTLITGLILHIILERENSDRDPAGLRHLLMDDAVGFELTIATMMNSTHPVISRIASGFSQKEPKERSAVVSTAQAATEVFESPRLAKITHRSSFQLDDLKNKTVSLFIVIPPEHLQSYRPYLRLMTGLCTAAMSRNATRPKHPVLFMLDELPALGYMRPIEEGIGYLAGYGAKLWLFVQDLDQLEKTYPKARSMIANCAVRQAFNVQDPETARVLSDMLGTTTVQVTSSGGSAPLPLHWLSIAFHHSQFETSRALMTPGEIMAMESKQQLLFVQGTPAIQARKLRYFDWWEWRFWRRK